MTRHRKPEEWKAEILEAAAAEIAESGYARFTMEAVIARTSLSKGGVYRFFSGRDDLALALFSRAYMRALDFDIDEVIGWGRPIEETMCHLLFDRFDDHAGRDEAVWLHLLPESLRNSSFFEERLRLLDQLKGKFSELVCRLIVRDDIDVPEGLERRLESALGVGQALMEGLALQGSLGTPRDEQRDIVRRVIHLLAADALGGNHAAV